MKQTINQSNMSFYVWGVAQCQNIASCGNSNVLIFFLGEVDFWNIENLIIIIPEFI